MGGFEQSQAMRIEKGLWLWTVTCMLNCTSCCAEVPRTLTVRSSHAGEAACVACAAAVAVAEELTVGVIRAAGVVLSAPQAATSTPSSADVPMTNKQCASLEGRCPDRMPCSCSPLRMGKGFMHHPRYT